METRTMAINEGKINTFYPHTNYEGKFYTQASVRVFTNRNLSRNAALRLSKNNKQQIP